VCELDVVLDAFGHFSLSEPGKIESEWKEEGLKFPVLLGADGEPVVEDDEPEDTKDTSDSEKESPMTVEVDREKKEAADKVAWNALFGALRARNVAPG